MRIRQTTAALLGFAVALAMLPGLALPAYADGPVDGSATVTITQDSLENATALQNFKNVGVNLEMSLVSDEMWNDKGQWMEQTLAASGIRVIRWGYDAWVFDWENETPLLDNYQGGNNTKDAAGSYGLREFLLFCKKYGVIPLVDIPIETYDHRDASASTTGPESLELVKRLAKSMAEYLQDNGFDEVYFDMGNEPWSGVSCKYGAIPAAKYGALFPDFYDIVKSVNPNYKLLLVHQSAGWDNQAEAATNGCYDGVDDHEYPRMGWTNYYNRNDDNIFRNGFGGNTPADKIKIKGECNLPWPDFPAYSTNLGSSIALANGFLDMVNDDYYTALITWPSHWPTKRTTANVGNATQPVGWFDLDEWYLEKAANRLTGPMAAEMLVQKNVLEQKVVSSSTNPKVRSFAYTNADKSELKVILVDKEKYDSLNLEIRLPSGYNRVKAMVMKGERDAQTRSASEWAVPEYTSHLAGNVDVASQTFTDTVPYGECVLVYTFIHDGNTQVPAAFSMQSPQLENGSTAQNFVWTTAARATNYKLTVSKNADLSTPVLDVYTGGETNFQPSADLEYGTDYYYRVTALNVSGETAVDGGIHHFSTVSRRRYVNDTVTTDSGEGSWAYTGSWKAQSYLGCLQGNDHATTAVGASATFTFTGTRAKIYGIRGYWCGKADISVDGGTSREMDFYRAKPIAQNQSQPTQDVLYDTGLLSETDQTHTVTVTMRADKNPAITGTPYLELDYAEVIRAEDTEFEPTPAEPLIQTDLPAELSQALGSTVTLHVDAVSQDGGVLSYEWYRDGVLLAGETQATLTLENLAETDRGAYLARVTNARGLSTKTIASRTCLLNGPEVVDTLADVLKRAEDTGINRTFYGGGQDFDGTRIVAGNADELARLKGMEKGTILIRFQTDSPRVGTLFAAGKDNARDHYGAVMTNGMANIDKMRVDFPDGMAANLTGTTVSDGEWHTFLYSVDASALPDKQGKTVTSFDGSTATQFPNYASWFNQNADINDLRFLEIGGHEGAFANSGSNQNFVGKIAFVAILPETFTQNQAAALTAETYEDPLIFTAKDVTLTSVSDAVSLEADVLQKLKGLDNASILIRYQKQNDGVGSLFSISDNRLPSTHFHIFESGNQIGFEYRNADRPKYLLTSTVPGKSLNTIAFQAERGVGYKLFANGELVASMPKTGSDYAFLQNLATLNSGFLGKTERSNDPDCYPFVGVIQSLEVYDSVLPEAELIERTGGSAVDVPIKVFKNGDTTGSTFFRIPFMLATTQDSVIVGADANFGSTGDSAENIDAAVRRKENVSAFSAADGWEDAFIPDALHLRDYADEPGYKQKSASHIDGMILQDLETGRILLQIDGFAWNGGGFQSLNVGADGVAHGGGARTVALGDGFATIGGNKYLLLSSRNMKSGNINSNTDRTKFDYAADIYGSKNDDGRYAVYHLNGTPSPYTATGEAVDDSNLSLGEISEYSLNENYELYKNGVALTVLQKSANASAPAVTVPMNMLYEDSELQVYNTSYIYQFYSDDDGVTWELDTIVSGMVKRENANAYLVGPGRGIQLQNGAYSGRLLFPVYYSGNGSKLTAEIIYSDDGGETWAHGESVVNTRSLSEAAMAELPDGSIRMFMRNASGNGKVICADSTDGGESWHNVQSAFGDTDGGINCQLSVLNLREPVVSKLDGNSYPAVLLTTGFSSARKNGRISVGLVKEEGIALDGTPRYRIDWEFQYTITGENDLFGYSCMAELSDGRIALLYESSPTQSWGDGLKYMSYREFTLEQLLGN